MVVMDTYTIFYDYCSDDSGDVLHDQKYIYQGSYMQLQQEIEWMKTQGCFNITAVYLWEDE